MSQCRAFAAEICDRRRRPIRTSKIAALNQWEPEATYGESQVPFQAEIPFRLTQEGPLLDEDPGGRQRMIPFGTRLNHPSYHILTQIMTS